MRSKSPELMSEIKKYIEDYYLQNRQSPSTTKIAEAVGIARGTAYKYLVEMAEKNMIEYDGSVGSVGRYDKKVCWRTDKSRLCAASPCDEFFKAWVGKSNPCDCGNAPGAEGFEGFEKQTLQPFLR